MPETTIEYDDKVPDELSIYECVGISDYPGGSEPITINRVVRKKAEGQLPEEDRDSQKER